MSNMIPECVKVPHFVGGGKVEWWEKNVPTPGPGQLLLKVRANALCGSERGQFYNGTDVSPGHEAAGEVVAAGPGTSTAVGTPGVVFLMDFCGECRSCKAGYTNQCLAKRADMGFTHDGGYGQYELIHENIFFPTPANLPLSEATFLLDIMGTGGHAIRRAQMVHPDIQSVLVPGAGPIGLGVLAMVKLMLGKDIPVYITDVTPYRLALAEKLGGRPILLTENTVAQGLAAYGAKSVDVAIDTSGKEAARRAALDALAQRGALIFVGHGEGLQLNISPDMIAAERSLVGSEYFAYDEMKFNLPLLQDNRAYMDQIITHRFPVDDIQHAFELFFKGNTGKVIIEQ